MFIAFFVFHLEWKTKVAVDTWTRVTNEADVISTYFALIGYSHLQLGRPVLNKFASHELKWNGGRSCEQVQLSSVQFMRCERAFRSQQEHVRVEKTWWNLAAWLPGQARLDICFVLHNLWWCWNSGIPVDGNTSSQKYRGFWTKIYGQLLQNISRNICLYIASQLKWRLN